MPDRESTITHLQIISTWASFARERDLQFFTAKHLEVIERWARDAIALLREQEPVEPTVSNAGEHDGLWSWWYQCGKCKMPINHGDRFCRHCGRTMKWNESD